jgi:ribose-phosphate pyrophosphokinase
MIDTAGTICAASEALKKNGALDVYACATHGVLSGPAIERINASSLKEVVITNTIRQGDDKKSPKIKVLSVGKLLGLAIKRVVNDEPLSGLFMYSYDKTKRELL